MDIQKAGSIGADQLRTRAQEQQPAQKQEAEVQAAQGTKIPEGAKNGQGTAASIGKEGENTSKQDAALKQAAAAAGNTAAATTTTTTEDDDDSAYQAIVQKADSGQALTSSELSQLRAKDPARYNKAVKAMQARDTLRQQMESDPSHASKAAKEAVAAIQAQAQQEGAAAIAGAHGTMDDTAAVVRALNDEYSSFARQYDQVLFDTAPGAIRDE